MIRQNALSLSDVTKAIIKKRRAVYEPTSRRRPGPRPKRTATSPRIAPSADIEMRLKFEALGPVGELRSEAAREISLLRQALMDIAESIRLDTGWEWCRERAARELERSL